MPNLNLVFLSDFFIFEQNKYLKLSTITTLPYLPIVGGLIQIVIKISRLVLN